MTRNSLNLLNMKLKRTLIFLSATVLLLLMNVVQLKAQGTPCGDPDVECPIDAPVVILLAAAILFLSVKKITDAEHAIKQPVKGV